MKKRSWYKKKRYWALVVLTIWIICSRLGVTNFRYDIAALEKEISSITGKETEFNIIPFQDNSAAYIKVGERNEAPLIVFVHGSPGSLTAANNYLTDERLLNQADIISIDRLGFGNSAYGIAEPSLQRQAAMLFEVLKPFLNRNIILVGHSMGGPILSKYAMDYPDQLEAMVLVAPSISPMLEPSNTWRRLMNIVPIRWLTPPAFRVCNQEIIPLKKELLAIEDQWSNIKVPVTIVHGTEDKLVPFGNANYAYTELVNSASKVIQKIENGDHFIFWTKHDLIVDEILNLLNVLD